MSKTNVFSLLLLLLILLPSSCSRKEEALYSPGMGGVMIDLTTDLPATKSGVTEETLSADDFKVEVINPDGVIFKRWNTFAEYKAEQEETGFQMNAGGPYRLRAMYGDSTAYGFDAVYFIGEQEFTVLPQETTEVQVICRMGNVKVAVRYGDNIRKNYSDFKATVYNEGGSLVFGKDCTEPGYLTAGELSVYIELTDHDGKKWYFQNGSTISAAAGDFVTLKVDTEYIPEMNVSLTVKVDSSTERHDIGVTLPSLMLPAGAPEMTSKGFSIDDSSISFVEGILPQEDSLFFASMDAPAGIYSLILSVQTTNPELAWASDVDLVNPTQEQRSKLQAAGFPLPDTLYRSRKVSIDFSSIVMLVRYMQDAATQSISLKVTDGLNKTAEGRWLLAPEPVVKSISQIDEGNVWARRVYNVTMTTNGNISQLYPVIQAEGSTEWVRSEFTETVSGQTKTVTITGLNPGTKYSVRAAYVDNSNVTEEVREFTTEVEQQVGNAGFEEWSSYVYEFTAVISTWPFEKAKLEWYRPYSDVSTAWWDVNSHRTMNDYYSLVGNQNERVFMTAAYNSDSQRGKYAMIFTTYVSATEYDILSAGEIFIGKAKDENGKDGGGSHDSEGHVFSSRPSALSFVYKYEPIQSETYYVEIVIKDADGVVIGSATDVSGSASSDWNVRRVDLNYSNFTKKAGSIYISFKSSSSDNPGYESRQIVLADGKEYSGCNIGSILYVDDIELIYE